MRISTIQAFTLIRTPFVVLVTLTARLRLFRTVAAVIVAGFVTATGARQLF